MLDDIILQFRTASCDPPRGPTIVVRRGPRSSNSVSSAVKLKKNILVRDRLWWWRQFQFMMVFLTDNVAKTQQIHFNAPVSWA